jgi:hypothetical protein
LRASAFHGYAWVRFRAGSIYRKVSYRIADIDISVTCRIDQQHIGFFSIYRMASAGSLNISIKRYIFPLIITSHGNFDVLTCAKFGLEPAATAALFFDSNVARIWLNLY